MLRDCAGGGGEKSRFRSTIFQLAPCSDDDEIDITNLADSRQIHFDDACLVVQLHHRCPPVK